ncbi:SusD/RagB family nutrient-binding outer membrane lipoprotein [Gramella jeungdoensis]|uniref:SusD/RagB family nutrient-binding outer membrane lipoprotein n=1 Tax=Gramella jeungdoensis TaxID=708091 RepID=A0ABT0YWF7_9FLAO|nr:SusD/RagB family nutrient-binding outer membrane lipoprotein [Gramella jeungdoensis]MCM8567801.1 SusD/RagB family nutrient-binding outer membrane lipoprotein [Gramella jeungdoensis]
MYKHIKNSVIKVFAMAIVLLGANSCETTELEILENPNALAPGNADVDFYLNSMQVDLASYFESITEEGMEVTRMLHMFGPIYSNAYQADQFDTPYSIAYADIIADARAIRERAEEQELYTHLGISKIIEAYVMISLVDYFGPVPYTEAIDGVNFQNPNVTPGAEIYTAMEALLDEAIADLEKEEAFLPTDDLYYDGDEDNWIAFANTLKLKMYVQTRLVDNSVTSKINDIVASGNYIDDSSKDFEFRYSTTFSNPDSRHPIFGRNFDVAADVTDYMSNSYMYYMAFEKSNRDPRTRYYFYRQSLTMTTNEQEAECINEEAPSHYNLDLYPFCYAANFNGTQDPTAGFWGRDHGDPDGIPPDGGKRTTWGVYPVGGKFDDSSGEPIPGRSIGLMGAGISPIMLASFSDFMLAEAALTMGVTGDAKTYLENGMRKSIEKVIDFGAPAANEALVPSDDDIDAYVNEVLADYDAASSEDEKLNIIVKQYFIALFGNGVEAYNTYRRTCKPMNLQPTLITPNDGFIRSFLYPNELVEQNINVDQKADHTQPVFWDTSSCSE